MASYDKLINKSGVEYFKIQISKGRGKKVYRNWYPPVGVSAKTVQSALNRYIAELEAQVEAGTLLTRKEEREAQAAAEAEAAKIRTVRQYAEKVFMPQLTIHASENTRDSYQRNLDLHILPAIGDIKLPEVTPAQITALLCEFQSKGKAISSCVKLYTILQGLFKSAYMDDSILRNPMDKVQRPKATKSEIRNEGPEFFSAEEEDQIIAALSGEDLKWRLYVNLLVETGIRRGEAGGLCWDCVDTKNKTIQIRRTVNYTKEKGTYISTPKSKQIRQIPLSCEVASLFEEWRREQSRDCLSQYVFNQNGSPEVMAAQTPTKFFAKFGEKHGIKDFHPHKLRHSFASICFQNKCDPVSVSAIMGHSDPAITLRVYSHTDENTKAQTANTFREALRASKKTKKAGEG